MIALLIVVVLIAGISMEDAREVIHHRKALNLLRELVDNPDSCELRPRALELLCEPRTPNSKRRI